MLIASLRGEGASVLSSRARGLGPLAPARRVRARGQAARRGRAARRRRRRQRGDYGVAQALCAQLFEALPELAESCARPHGALLDDLLAARRPSHPPPADTQPERRDLQARCATSCCRSPRAPAGDRGRRRRAHRRALGGAARRARRPGRAAQADCLLTAERDAPSPALAFLRGLSRTIELEPLTAEQTEALLRSVFGDVEHLVADRRAHPRAVATATRARDGARPAPGRPRLARYEAGSWTLPASSRGRSARVAAAALAARVAALSPDARELAETLALTDPAALALVTTSRSPATAITARTYRALDALLAASVLAAGRRALPLRPARARPAAARRDGRGAPARAARADRGRASSRATTRCSCRTTCCSRGASARRSSGCCRCARMRAWASRRARSRCSSARCRSPSGSRCRRRRAASSRCGWSTTPRTSATTRASCSTRRRCSRGSSARAGCPTMPRSIPRSRPASG